MKKRNVEFDCIIVFVVIGIHSEYSWLRPVFSLNLLVVSEQNKKKDTQPVQCRISSVNSTNETILFHIYHRWEMQKWTKWNQQEKRQQNAASETTLKVGSRYLVWVLCVGGLYACAIANKTSLSSTLNPEQMMQKNNANYTRNTRFSIWFPFATKWNGNTNI